MEGMYQCTVKRLIQVLIRSVLIDRKQHHTKFHDTFSYCRLCETNHHKPTSLFSQEGDGPPSATCYRNRWVDFSTVVHTSHEFSVVMSTLPTVKAAKTKIWGLTDFLFTDNAS